MDEKEVSPLLHILLDTDRKANTERLLQRLCAENGRSILLVPEQFSHAAERMLCRTGGNRISRRAEVLSFSRLANRVFSDFGGTAETETDQGGKLLMMSLAVENVQSRLKLYANCAAKPEFLLKLLDTLDEFRSYRVTAQTLREASQRLSGVLAVKTEEFALLMESPPTSAKTRKRRSTACWLHSSCPTTPRASTSGWTASRISTVWSRRSSCSFLRPARR